MLLFSRNFRFHAERTVRSEIVIHIAIKSPDIHSFSLYHITDELSSTTFRVNSTARIASIWHTESSDSDKFLSKFIIFKRRNIWTLKTSQRGIVYSITYRFHFKWPCHINQFIGWTNYYICNIVIVRHFVTMLYNSSGKLGHVHLKKKICFHTQFYQIWSIVYM